MLSVALQYFALTEMLNRDMLSLDSTPEGCTVSALLLRCSLVMLCGTNSPGQLLLKKLKNTLG